MSIVHATFRDGVFKPDGPVELPDQCRVTFEPHVVTSEVDPVALDRLYAVLGERYDSDDEVTSVHHDEHQP